MKRVFCVVIVIAASLATSVSSVAAQDELPNVWVCDNGGPNAQIVDRISLDAEGFYVVVGTDRICSDAPDACPAGALTAGVDRFIRCGQSVSSFCPTTAGHWYRDGQVVNFVADGGFVGTDNFFWQAPWDGPVPTRAQAGSVLELTYLPGFQSRDADTLRLYWAFFKRDPDLGGAKYWLKISSGGLSLDGIAANFADSDEFRLKFGATTNEEFLSIVYTNVLDRSPDPDGFAYWLGEMNRGLSRGGVVRWVAANPEFIDRHPYPDTAARSALSPISANDTCSG